MRRSPTMDQEGLWKIIEDSSQDDWLINDDRGIYTYRRDVNVRLVENRGREREFTEDWHQDLPDASAKYVPFDLFYGASFVEEIPAVSVDGGRSVIPMPDREHLTITKRQHAFGRIVDLLDNLDDYLDRCNIQVT